MLIAKSQAKGKRTIQFVNIVIHMGVRVSPAPCKAPVKTMLRARNGSAQELICKYLRL